MSSLAARRSPLAAVLLLVAAPLLPLRSGSAVAQSEAALRDAFEGRMVTVRLDMPATDDGIDLRPAAPRPVDFPKVASQLKQFGTAVHTGQSIMVTKVKVKAKLIEFQLGGGGFGTFGDNDATSVSVGSTPRSKREQALEKSLKTEADPARKQSTKDELDDLRKAREAEDRRNEATVAGAAEAKAANVRQRRLDGDSRFNLRYDNSVPASAMTPDAIRSALAAYVDFGLGGAGAPASAPTAAPAGELQKGMLLGDVEMRLGPASKAEERNEGTLTVSVRTYTDVSRRNSSKECSSATPSAPTSGRVHGAMDPRARARSLPPACPPR